MNRPGAILIGGPPGAGKTTLGRALASRLGWLSLSGDDLMTAAVAVTDTDTHPELHRVRSVGHTRYFTSGSPDKLISDALEIQDSFWPAIARVVRRHIALDDPVVVDWWLLAPALVADLTDVASYWIHVNPGVLAERERANTDFLEGSSDPEQMLSNFMARSLWRNDYVLAEARAAGLHILEQDGNKTVAALAAQITDSLG